MFGEFQSMAFTSSALWAFCTATNFVKKVRASVSSAAADAGRPEATVMMTMRRTALEGVWIERENRRRVAAIAELTEFVMLTSVRFSTGFGRRAFEHQQKGAPRC